MDTFLAGDVDLEEIRQALAEQIKQIDDLISANYKLICKAY